MATALKNLARVWVSAVAIGLLSACGGGATDQTGSASPSAAASISAPALPSFLPTSNAPPSAQMIALQLEGGRLNSQELAQIAATGILPIPFDGPLISGAQNPSKLVEKSSVAAAPLPQLRANATLGASLSTASLTPAYRFYNNSTLGHFYTTNTAERDYIRANLPVLSYEGSSFLTSPISASGLSPVHRFYNTLNGVHFYTITESERAFVAANFPNFKYEGIAYYASTVAATGLMPLYRFYYSSKGFHFYTSNLAERDYIRANYPSYTYEGVGYYVWGGNAPVISNSLTGVAATGAALSNAAVTAKCSNGKSVSGTTDANGKFSLDLSATQAAPPMHAKSAGG